MYVVTEYYWNGEDYSASENSETPVAIYEDFETMKRDYECMGYKLYKHTTGEALFRFTDTFDNEECYYLVYDLEVIKSDCGGTDGINRHYPEQQIAKHNCMCLRCGETFYNNKEKEPKCPNCD